MQLVQVIAIARDRTMLKTEFTILAHVAITVSDLDRSLTWHNQRFSAKPALDEDTGPACDLVDWPARRRVAFLPQSYLRARGFAATVLG